jgi:hypothetical protein
MKILTAAVGLFVLACGVAKAQDVTGRWTGTADTIDAGGIPLKVIREGDKLTLLGDIEFEGGEHLRWYLELNDGRLNGGELTGLVR